MSSFLKIKIPSEWEIKKLKDCATINPENLNINDINEDFINYVDIASIDSSTFQIKEVKRIPISDIPSRARRVIKENDVIISTVRPYLKAFSKVNMEHDNFICSTGFAVLRAKEGLNYEYLFQWILNQKFVNYMISQMVGSSYPAVKMSDVETAPIIIPPLNEQIRISSILSNVDISIIKTQKLIDNLRVLKKGLMQCLFTEGIGHTEFIETRLGKIPKEWEIVNFDNSIIKQKYKKGSLKTNEYQLTGNFPIIDQGLNFISGYSDRAELLYNGDLPVVIFGDHTRIFKFIDFKFICGADGTKILIPNTSLFDPLYLFYAYSNFRIKNLGYSRHYKLLKEFKILKPQLEEQKRISSILGNIDNQILAENKIKGEFKLIKKGLMEDLLTGKKRVKIN